MNDFKCSNKSDYRPPVLDSDTAFERKVAGYMRRFTRFLHVFFSLALVITVLMTLGIFFSEIYHVVITDSNLANGMIHALGTLLILWTLSELLNSEIRHLQGEKIRVTIFIEVAIAALVRKLLILTTEGVNITQGGLYLASLLVLGIVYFLLTARRIKNSDMEN